MRKSLLALIMSSTLFLSGCGAMFKSSVTTPGGSSTLSTYEGESFRIDVPDSWSLVTETEEQVAFQSPKESDEDAYQEWFRVSMTAFGARVITNEVLREAVLEDIDIHGSHQVTDARAIEIAGIPAYQVIFKDLHGGWDFVVLKIIAVQDLTAYTFQFAAEEQRYNEYFTTIETMLNSFQAK